MQLRSLDVVICAPYRCGRECANHSGVGVNVPTTMVCHFVCPWPWYSLEHRLVIMTVACSVGYCNLKCVKTQLLIQRLYLVPLGTMSDVFVCPPTVLPASA